MLVLTPKYGSQIDLDLIKKQKDKTKEPLINHRWTLDLTSCKTIKKAYLTFLDNKDKYIIGYKPKDAKEINRFVSTLGEIDTLDVSWIDVSKLDSLYDCFSHCKIKHIIGLDQWDVSNVRSMIAMFWKCKNLESVYDISEWNVSNVYDMSCMFEGCDKLKNIGDISGWNVSNIRSMWLMFSKCYNLEKIGDLNMWKLQNNVDAKDMFYMTAVTPFPSWYSKKH